MYHCSIASVCLHLLIKLSSADFEVAQGSFVSFQMKIQVISTHSSALNLIRIYTQVN